MIEVYYYVPREKARSIVECGLKLSQWADRCVTADGEEKSCFSALLTPRDDPDGYRSDELTCLKLEVAQRHCYIADRCLYLAGYRTEQIKRLYDRTIIPVDNYIFGAYRIPECLVTCTIIPGSIYILDKRLDSPILYDNSEDLYVNNLIEEYREHYDDFNDMLLYLYYSRLADMGRMDAAAASHPDIKVFTDRHSGRAYITRLPSLLKDGDSL